MKFPRFFYVIILSSFIFSAHAQSNKDIDAPDVFYASTHQTFDSLQSALKLVAEKIEKCNGNQVKLMLMSDDEFQQTYGMDEKRSDITKWFDEQLIRLQMEQKHILCTMKNIDVRGNSKVDLLNNIMEVDPPKGLQGLDLVIPAGEQIPELHMIDNGK